MIEVGEAYMRTQKEDYAARANDLGRELRVRLNSIVCGPTYSIATKKGANLTVYTYQVPSGASRRIDFAIALDDIQEVVGHKVVVLDEEEDSILASNGAIYVAKRGVGLATPIEMVSFHLLQHEADAKQKDILYTAVNRNAEYLHHVQETIHREQNERLPLSYEPTMIDELVEESKRWHSLFGPQGSLGFDPLTRKVFSHTDAVENLDPSSVIELATTEAMIRERKLTVPKVLSVQSDSHEGDVISEKRKFLQEQILPKLESFAA